MESRWYAAIDLKSFYASVECVERGFDPLTTNLVVADESRTEKTICLAVSPSLKAYGIPGRPRLFEVVEEVRRINENRRKVAPGQRFSGSSVDAEELRADPALELAYITAPPRMEHYVNCSAGIYDVYLQFIAPEDIHVYSIDEVFIDLTPYLRTYRTTPRELTMRLIRAVYERSGVTATAGIGTNLYLCKVAMDIVAKHAPPDEYGVRIAELDELRYRKLLWAHRPLTDFWRVGPGIARKLEANGMFTMGDVARCSLGRDHERLNQALLYKLFGVNAELLIDHAWGWESATIPDIKAYKPEQSSISSGQVLPRPYDFEKGKLILREMTDLLVLQLVEKNLTTDQLVLSVGYDADSLADPQLRRAYTGQVSRDYYGRTVPKSAHGSVNLNRRSSSTKAILRAVTELYEHIVDPRLLVRRMYVVANRVLPEQTEAPCEQLTLLTDPETAERERRTEQRERQQQQAVLRIRKKFGRNAILKGMNLEEGATTIQRNEQIGGHRKS